MRLGAPLRSWWTDGAEQIGSSDRVGLPARPCTVDRYRIADSTRTQFPGETICRPAGRASRPLIVPFSTEVGPDIGSPGLRWRSSAPSEGGSEDETDGRGGAAGEGFRRVGEAVERARGRRPLRTEPRCFERQHEAVLDRRHHRDESLVRAGTLAWNSAVSEEKEARMAAGGVAGAERACDRLIAFRNSLFGAVGRTVDPALFDVSLRRSGSGLSGPPRRGGQSPS